MPRVAPEGFCCSKEVRRPLRVSLLYRHPCQSGESPSDTDSVAYSTPEKQTLFEQRGGPPAVALTLRHMPQVVKLSGCDEIAVQLPREGKAFLENCGGPHVI